MRELLDILPDDVATDWYCLPGKWHLWEERVAQPALEALGYKVLSWRTGEKDSFGPLSRVVLTERDGNLENFIYG